MVHNTFDARCLQVYFILSQNNFTFGDAISMWEKSFVFKNGCMYALDHLSYKVILENQKSYNNIQSSRILFS